MDELFPTGARWQEVAAALSRGPGEVRLRGLTPPAGAYVVSRLFLACRRPFLVLTPDEAVQETLERDLAFFLGDLRPAEELWPRLLPFPAHELLPFQELSGDAEVSAARVGAAWQLLTSRDPVLVTAPLLALRQRLLPREALREALLYLVVGEEVRRQEFLTHLAAAGYERRPVVEEPGEVSVRGGIIDLYPPLYAHPVRLEFFGDELESIRFFDPATQRSLGASVEELVLLPAKEVVLTPAVRARALAGRSRRRDPRVWQHLQEGLYLPGLERHLAEFYPEPETLWDYLPPETVVVLWDPMNLAREEDRQAAQAPPEPEGWLDPAPARSRARAFAQVRVEFLPVGAPAEDNIFEFRTAPLAELAQELAREGAGEGRLLPVLARRLRSWQEQGAHLVLVCLNPHRARRLSQLLAQEGLEAEVLPRPVWENGGRVHLTAGEISGGFRWDAEGLLVLTEDEALGFVPERRRRRDTPPPQHLTSLADLKEGDFVVHLDHGIGIYRGLVKLTAGAQVNDYLEIEYQGGDRLFVPVDRLHLLQKYLGVEEVPPKVDRLGGKSWERTKKRVRQAVEKIARELVELYAARQVLPGHRFSPPDQTFREFEATFPFEETPDQLQAIQDVLEDMQREKPMDRLICGDVGYGKTEVAVRAAFRAAMDGKQVAVLVPTTVLAEQHHETFTRRLATYPLVVRVLSRFKPPAEQRRILADLAAGKVDIIIGTHRLLSRDVVFKDLGLLIIDEEQRFGVKQKEKLKEWRKTVDVLTLTATPIPRTLQLSLSGLRELSLINTPPENRRAIRTYLCRPDREVIQAAIRRELARRGQVFFVHNRVQTLPRWARFVQELVPEARVAMAHGQMPERQLEQVMVKFWRGEVDVLVCTAIIEAGLDIPAANTIIVNRAHTLGLAQLYQLRGRVGRSQAQAYAYLLVPDEAGLTPEAQKRLKALMEFTELGSGYRIALHDLQIRGGGNLLGQAQSGHLAEVGYELYLQLLEQAIREFKGEAPEDLTPDPELRVPVAAYLPEDYVPDEQERLALYRRLSGRLTPALVEEIAAELKDRFGPLPPEGENLLEAVRLKGELRRLGIKRLELHNGRAVIQFAAPERLHLKRLLDFLHQYPKRLRLTPDQSLHFLVGEEGPPWVRLQNCLKELEIFVKGEGEG
ncbi:MAG: transcription-repair coupling factor [Syntrophobacterales bacterium]|nr:transcription-repair coupling factor [Syntrophobacterales bacterium]